MIVDLNEYELRFVQEAVISQIHRRKGSGFEVLKDKLQIKGD